MYGLVTRQGLLTSGQLVRTVAAQLELRRSAVTLCYNRNWSVCVCVVQYCAVSMLLRTVLVLRGSQWQSRFSCFDAANPFARSGLRVLDDTHIVRILINRLSKAFRMLWLLPGKVDSAQLV